MDFLSSLFGTQPTHNERIALSYYGNDGANPNQPNPNNRSYLNRNASFYNRNPLNNYNAPQPPYFPPRRSYKPRPQPVYNPNKSQWQRMKEEVTGFRLSPNSIFNRGGKATKKPRKRTLKKKRRPNKK
jgi:hypothetical protein